MSSLSVIVPFAGYAHGDLITDPAVVSTILQGPYAGYVVKLGDGSTPAAATTPKTLVQLLAEAIPQTIDTQPDADGNPPPGYEWISGIAAIKNYAYSALDQVQTLQAYNGGAAPALPCSEVLAFQSGSGIAFGVQTEVGSFSVTLAAGLTLQQLLGVKLLAGDPNNGTGSLLVVYTATDSSNERTLHSVVVGLDATTSNEGSLALTTEVIPTQAVAVASGSYLLRMTQDADGTPAFLAIDSATGAPSVVQAHSSIGSYTTAILGASGSTVLVGSAYDNFIRIRQLTIDRSGPAPVVKAVQRNIALMLPGMTDTAAPGAVAVTSAGTFTVCTRAGYFEVAMANDGTVAAKQVAGVHPLIALEGGADTAQLDVISAAYSLLNPGTLMVTTSQRVYYVDYTTLQSLFVRKARLAG